jgi:polyphosphate kinase
MEPPDAQRIAAPEPVEAVAPRAEAAPPDLEDASLYFNRELSWLDFNDRVLQLPEDPSVPLMERVKFCAIWESNLDEFYMVRVANLHDQLEAGMDARGADGMGASEQIDAIRERVIGQRDRLTRCAERDLRPAMAEHGIRIISPQRANDKERADLDHIFESSIFPVLTPLAIGLGRPFPYISNLSLSLAVILHDPDQGTEIIARVKVPKELLGRFVEIGNDGHTLVPLEDVIAANLASLFPGMEVTDYAFFRVTRDTDYDVSDEADDLLQAVEEELRRRRFGEVVRLEVEESMSPRLRDQLKTALKIEDRQLYEVDGLIDMADMWDCLLYTF